MGTETWGDVIRSVRNYGTGSFLKSRFSRDKKKKSEQSQEQDAVYTTNDPKMPDPDVETLEPDESAE